MRLAFICIFVISAFGWSVAQTAPPAINYQGRLSRPNGSPIAVQALATSRSQF